MGERSRDLPRAARTGAALLAVAVAGAWATGVIGVLLVSTVLPHESCDNPPCHGRPVLELAGQAALGVLGVALLLFLAKHALRSSTDISAGTALLALTTAGVSLALWWLLLFGS